MSRGGSAIIGTVHAKLSGKSGSSMRSGHASKASCNWRRYSTASKRGGIVCIEEGDASPVPFPSLTASCLASDVLPGVVAAVVPAEGPSGVVDDCVDPSEVVEVDSTVLGFDVTVPSECVAGVALLVEV